MSQNLQLLTEWCPINATKESINESKRINDGKIILKEKL